MPSTNVVWPIPLQRLTPFYPGQFGVAGTDSDRGLRQDCNGKIIWVDPNHVDANDQRDGTNPDAPMATVAAALTKCNAYSGDVVAVMFNSFWTYGNVAVGRAAPITESVIVTTPGIRIVGVAPSGSLGVPWVPPLTNSTCVTVRAMDVLIEGFNFWMSGALVGTTGVLAEWDAPNYFGENLTLRHNFFYALAYGVQLDYTWNCYIEDCRFERTTIAAVNNPSVYGEPDYNTIRNNAFLGNAIAIDLPGCDNELIEGNRLWDNTVALSLPGGGDNVIHANVIKDDPTGTNNYIDLTGGANNMVCDNYLGCTLAQYDVTCSDSTSGSWVRNHCVDGETAAAPI